MRVGRIIVSWKCVVGCYWVVNPIPLKHFMVLENESEFMLSAMWWVLRLEIKIKRS